MIINIPIQIDEDFINNVIAVDYQSKVEKHITDMVIDRLKDACGLWNRNPTPKEGIRALVDNQIERVILNDFKDEIIDRAAEKLASRVSRTKAAKEIGKENE